MKPLPGVRRQIHRTSGTPLNTSTRSWRNKRSCGLSRLEEIPENRNRKNHLYRGVFEQYYVWAGFRRANSPSSSGHCNVHMGDSCVSGLRQVPAVFLHEHSAPRSKLFSHGAAPETDTLLERRVRKGAGESDSFRLHRKRHRFSRPCIHHSN